VLRCNAFWDVLGSERNITHRHQTESPSLQPPKLPSSSQPLMFGQLAPNKQRVFRLKTSGQFNRFSQTLHKNQVFDGWVWESERQAQKETQRNRQKNKQID